MAGKIFINYRREDTRADARNIRDRLAGAFGASRVFMDVDNLVPGQRFDQQLAKALAQCDVFLAVIGPHWQSALEARAQMPAPDYVREEIAAALAQRIPVIPVLIERTPLPAAESLPPDMQPLVLYHKHELVHERFGRDVEDLIAAIRAIMQARGHADEPLPADLAVSAEVLRQVEASPLFADSPPVLASAYHLTCVSRFERAQQVARRSISERTARWFQRALVGTPSHDRKISVRTLRPGVLRRDEVITSQGRTTLAGTSASLLAANGLFEISARHAFGKAYTITTRLLWLGTTEGRLFPVEAGNRASYVATYQVTSYSKENKERGNLSGEMVLTRRVNVTQRCDASSLHPDLTGGAYLAGYEDDLVASSGFGSTDAFTTKRPVALVYVDVLGLWIETETQSATDEDTLIKNSLISFALAP
jgi:hypothetical protein